MVKNNKVKKVTKQFSDFSTGRTMVAKYVKRRLDT